MAAWGMRLIAISGSTRAASTNTAMLECFCQHAPPNVEMFVYRGLADLPAFSPDREGVNTPLVVRDFINAIRHADGIILASPEYVRSIPGGLKNAIDWLVSGDEIIGKPVVLAHASHRGGDMLVALRFVLATVTQRFNPNLFLQLPLMSKSPEQVREFLQAKDCVQLMETFLRDFTCGIVSGRAPHGVTRGDSGNTWPESVDKSVDRAI